MLPIKFLLLNTNQFKGSLNLEVVQFGDDLMFKYSLYQFKGVLTNTIIESFNVNSSNKTFFKSLPLEMVYENKMSIIQCEQFYIYCQQMQEYINNNGVIPATQLPGINIYLDLGQIFSLQNFLYNFVKNYEIMKFNMQVVGVKNKQSEDNQIIPESNNQEAQIDNNPIEETNIEIENIKNNDEIILLQDVLKLSPNKMCTYYISKMVHNIINIGRNESINITLNEKKVTIEFLPMFNTQLIFISQYQQLILDILKSFDFSQSEYINKLKSLVNILMTIINNVNVSTHFITLKIVELLFYIYAVKISPNSILNEIQLKQRLLNRKDNYFLVIVNEAIEYILINYYMENLTQLDYSSIELKHLLYSNSDSNLDIEKLKNILIKERYLIDIDKSYFINNVLDKYNKIEDVKKPKLILNKPNKLMIDDIIDTDCKGWLNYKIIEIESQYDNTVITREYYDILKIIHNPTTSINIKTHPIISKYTDTIINIIFKELSSNISSDIVVSTLDLINTYIRPYLNDNSSVQTELFILYRIVVPYLYDNGNNIFMDYFH